MYAAPEPPRPFARRRHNHFRVVEGLEGIQVIVISVPDAALDLRGEGGVVDPPSFHPPLPSPLLPQVVMLGSLMDF